MLFLPDPKEPEPISINGSILNKVISPYDGQFVIVQVEKRISVRESLNYLQEWEKLNASFDRRDMTELLGFSKKRDSISSIQCDILINCRNGEYYRIREKHFDEIGRLINYIDSDEKRVKMTQIPKASTIDEIATRFCEKSAY
jgi:mRNA-degrading endonuclease RelE of RelBE toxin-antitoxin system